MGPVSCLTGSKYLSIYSEVINQQSRASTRVNTPDRLHHINPHGQRLFVSWHLPKKFLGKPLEGKLFIRFVGPYQEEIPFTITSLHDSLTYEIINEDFFDKKGILTYSVEIYSEGQKIDHFNHKMWTDLILVK